MLKTIIVVSFMIFGARCIENLSELTNDEIREIVINAASDKRIHLPSPTEPINFVPKANKIFRGLLSLSGGIGYGANNFKLSGKITRDKDNVIYIPVYFSNITYDYEYDMNLKILNNHGNVWGYMLGMSMAIPVKIEDNKFVLDRVPVVPNNTLKKVEFRNGGIMEDLILNRLSNVFYSVVNDLMSSSYNEFYANNVVKQINNAVSLSKKKPIE